MGLAELKAMQEKLDRIEATTGNSGAIPRTPKQMLLDIREIQEKDPDYHYRFVQIGSPEKAQGRIIEGYRMVPEDEGGRVIGNLALMKIPRAKRDERVARQDAISARRLDEHNDEMLRAAESVAKELRDKHGIRMSPEELLVKE